MAGPGPESPRVTRPVSRSAQGDRARGSLGAEHFAPVCEGSCRPGAGAWPPPPLPSQALSLGRGHVRSDTQRQAARFAHAARVGSSCSSLGGRTVRVPC